jgi:hypothetical protein
MNAKLVSFVESITMALLTLAFFMTVVGVTPASAGGVKVDVKVDADVPGGLV